MICERGVCGVWVCVRVCGVCVCVCAALEFLYGISPGPFRSGPFVVFKINDTESFCLPASCSGYKKPKPFVVYGAGAGGFIGNTWLHFAAFNLVLGADGIRKS